MSFPYGQTITVIPTTRDVHGDETRGTPRKLHGIGVAPRASTETTQDRRVAQTISGVALYLPPGGHGITAQDIVILDDAGGTEWRVDGHPVPWSNPLTGYYPADQVDLTRVEG